MLEQSLPNLSQLNHGGGGFLEASPGQKSLYTDSAQVPLETRYSFHNQEYESPKPTGGAGGGGFRFGSAQK